MLFSSIGAVVGLGFLLHGAKLVGGEPAVWCALGAWVTVWAGVIAIVARP
jgi:hypothetical protein